MDDATLSPLLLTIIKIGFISIAAMFAIMTLVPVAQALTPASFPPTMRGSPGRAAKIRRASGRASPSTPFLATTAYMIYTVTRIGSL